MTSRRSSDRTARSESRRPTVRRGIKKRGILPSFGDIVLPIVSVAAVGLLVLAGRQFFLNGIKSSPGIASTRAYAEAPALKAERERKQEVQAPVTETKPASQSVTPAQTPPKQEDTSFLAVAAALDSQKPKTTNASPAPASAKKPAPAPAKTQPKPQPKPQPAKTVSTPAKAPAKTAAKTPAPAPAKTPAKTQAPATAKTPAKTTPAKTQTVSTKQWRVQIGAYTSKTGAQEAANKLKKAGYTATVYSNPASKHHRVWVNGGTDKKSAEKVVEAMKKLGYSSSFAFPPAK